MPTCRCEARESAASRGDIIDARPSADLGAADDNAAAGGKLLDHAFGEGGINRFNLR
jgi:hypothetical protein